MVFRYSLTNTYNALLWPLLIVQTMAIAEPIHAAFGFTNSRVLPSLLQVFSRLWMAWVIVFGSRSSVHLSFIFMIMSWYSLPLNFHWRALADICRLSFYLGRLIRQEHTLWYKEVEAARYNWFILLYPIGAFSEWIQIYRAWSTFSLISHLFYFGLLLVMIIWPIGNANPLTNSLLRLWIHVQSHVSTKKCTHL